MLIGSLLISGGFLFAFIWNVKDGQYEDDYSPAHRILFDNTTETTNNSKPIN